MKLLIQLLCAALVLTTPSCPAPHQQGAGNHAGGPTLKRLDDLAGAGNDGLLLKAVQCFAPHDWCTLLTLDKEGIAVKSTRTGYPPVVEQSAKLSANQLAEVRRMIARLQLGRTAPPTGLTDGETYTAFVLFDEEGYARYDYAGPPPEEVQRVVYVLSAEIDRQSESLYEQRE